MQIQGPLSADFASAIKVLTAPKVTRAPAPRVPRAATSVGLPFSAPPRSSSVLSPRSAARTTQVRAIAFSTDRRPSGRVLRRHLDRPDRRRRASALPRLRSPLSARRSTAAIPAETPKQGGARSARAVPRFARFEFDAAARPKRDASAPGIRATQVRRRCGSEACRGAKAGLRRCSASRLGCAGSSGFVWRGMALAAPDGSLLNRPTRQRDFWIADTCASPRRAACRSPGRCG